MESLIRIRIGIKTKPIHNAGQKKKKKKNNLFSMQYGQLLSYAYIKKHILLGNFNIFVWKITSFFFQSHLADGGWKPEGGGH